MTSVSLSYFSIELSESESDQACRSVDRLGFDRSGLVLVDGVLAVSTVAGSSATVIDRSHVRRLREARSSIPPSGSDRRPELKEVGSYWLEPDHQKELVEVPLVNDLTSGRTASSLPLRSIP